MAELLSGAITFLFTDIEGSTRLLKQLRERYALLLADHQRLLRAAFAAHGGHEVDTQGDSFFIAFTSAREAVLAAVEGQLALLAHSWPDGVEVKVRMGLHTGQAVASDGRYTGLAVHRAARICAAGHGGQVLVSQATQTLLEDEEEDLHVFLRDLGEQRLKDLDRPVRLYQAAGDGLPETFPPVRREGELAQAAETAIARPAWRRPIVLVAAALGLAAVTVSAVVLAGGGGGDSESQGGAKPIVSASNAVAAIEPDGRRSLRTVAVSGHPARVEATRNGVWVGNDDSRTLTALTGSAASPSKLVAVGGFPSDVAVGEGAVWVVDGKSGLLRKVDPVYGAVLKQIRVVPPNPFYDLSRESFDPVSVTAGAGAVWVTDGSTRLVRIEPSTGKVTNRFNLRSPLNAVAAGSGAVWAVSGAAAKVIRLDGRGRVQYSIPIASKPGLDSPFPLQVALGDGLVWVLNGNTATVTKIDPGQRAVSATVAVGIDHRPVRLAAGRGAGWVASRDGTLARIDADTNAVALRWVAPGLADVAVGKRGVWVATARGPGGTPNLATGGDSGDVQALPTSFCSPIYHGGSRPQYLIASDLRLQGDGTTAAQLSQAIQYALKQRGFRAGTYAIGYQSCDVSVAASTADSDDKCTANAKAYATSPRLVGVIGSFTSGCTQVELPIINRRTKGTLPLISFSNTYTGLTRAARGTEPGEPGRYYPAKVRNYVRIAAADDVQAAASAMLAKELGARRAYVVVGEFPGGSTLADAFTSAAVKLGIRVGGEAPVRPATDYAGVAAVIKRARPDVVFISWYLDPSTVGLLTSLRSALGADVTLLTSDGFSNFAQLVELGGAAAEGMTVSVPVIPPARLPAAGKRFAAAFRREVGEAPGAYAALAAQAADVLLDAIARSDGTRASVRAELFKTDVRGGILGDFTIDANGDTTAGTVTIYRIERGSPRVFRVITPRTSLVR